MTDFDPVFDKLNDMPPGHTEVPHADLDLDAIRITIQHAKEDAERWYNAARPLTGLQHFSFAGAGRMLNNVADAAEKLLAALGDTVPQTDVDDATNEGIEWMHRAKRAEAERDALAHVIEQVRGWQFLWWGTSSHTGGQDLRSILDADPAVSLALHDAEVWDEGYEVGNEDQYGSATPSGKSYDPSPNPYRFPVPIEQVAYK